jgi:hypothetical protein
MNKQLDVMYANPADGSVQIVEESGEVAWEGKLLPTPNLQAILQLKVAVDVSNSFMRSFDTITEALRLWPETLELMWMSWSFPTWAVRARPFDHEID